MSNKLYIWDEQMQITAAPEKKPFIRDDKPDEMNTNRNKTEERGGWGNKLDFLMSCISLSVGLGNVWRFPYLCYKNGGGTFLITYHIAMIFCGIPLFFQEVAVGQYLGSGGMTFVGQLCPIFKGVGYATMTIVFLLDVYYCVIIAWTLFYIYSSLSSTLPWATCDNWWNTDNCFVRDNSTLNTTNITRISSSPVEEFFDRRLLNITSGLEEIGGIQWNIFIALCIGWIFVYTILRKGLHQSGKVVWFTALFPYVILLIMLVRAVMLEGASTGLLYYVTPRWEALLTPGPWMDGASQIFFAYSIGCGALPALGSYNKFHHNSYKDAVITCIVNTMTSVIAGIVTFSILGHLALEQGTDVGNVVKSGPGLVFITYPQVVLKLPGSSFWSATFFFMLLLLGIDSEFCLVESFITGILDNWSQSLRSHRHLFTAGVCSIMFLLGIPMITQGGMYIFQLMDYYSASGMSLLWVCFFQTIAISWFFGVDRLADCIQTMMGVKPALFWMICWKYITPLVMAVIFISQCFEYQRLYYGNYEYPLWADIIGLGLSFSSMMWIPAYLIYYISSQPGSIIQNFKNGIKSTVAQRKISICDKSTGELLAQSSSNVI
ncbi:sodium- and chloride-dependent GABA transporter 1-like [Diorhabda sublineata]|uniref:sodium- and chloride-dependent GABA transporter 1-like n=1 Tax=Diorhabda sublineata TaxID=1163346 RepID=UPI0024E06496|nr:sodium- and chloride-dependent GABA transporter 1-like [Diorhabda sublineata]XP_056638435.1 sodium- and chloride-dependent GABA transporter 1-like [Diorhabda sublineata]